MPKQVYCAKCGTELLMKLTAIPAEGRVISVVEPHTCDVKTVMKTIEENEIPAVGLHHDGKGGFKRVGTTSGRVTASGKESKLAGPSEVMFEDNEEVQVDDVDKKAKVAALFDEFPFVKKLNKAAKEHEVPEDSGDKRDKKFHREELITSSAPTNVRILSKSTVGETKTHDNRQLEEPKDGQS